MLFFVLYHHIIDIDIQCTLPQERTSEETASTAGESVVINNGHF